MVRVARRWRPVRSTYSWEAVGSWNTMDNEPGFANHWFHPEPRSTSAADSRVLRGRTALVVDHDRKHGRATSRAAKGNVVSMWISEYRKAALVHHGKSGYSGQRGFSSATQRRANRRCAASSRSNQRPKGARLSVMLARNALTLRLKNNNSDTLLGP